MWTAETEEVDTGVSGSPATGSVPGETPTDRYVPSADSTDDHPLGKPLADGGAPPDANGPDADVLDYTRGMWQEVEPADRQDPVAHRLRAWMEMDGVAVFGASRRGRSHAHTGAYREDAFALNQSGRWTVVVVCDGAGSQPLARVGAGIAAESCAQSLAADLRGLDPMRDDDAVHAELRTAGAEAVAASLGALVVASSSRRRPLNDFSTTLVACAYATHGEGSWLLCIQIGDGGILYRDAAGLSGLTNADRGAFAGETRFLTSPAAVARVADAIIVYRTTRPMTALAVGSDGVMDDFMTNDRRAYLMDAIVQAASSPRPAVQLEEFLGYELRGSFDDRTLVALVPTGSS
jgi:hypothetical protein